MEDNLKEFFSISRLTPKQIGVFFDEKFICEEAIINNTCQRCGNKNVLEFCENCNEFGVLKNGDKLFFYPYKSSGEKYDFDLSNLLLTSKQKVASDFILSKLNKEKRVLIWAVCGAGKTEIVFQAIREILRVGGIICFAIPRVDILYEIEERIRETFVGVKTSILNGNEEKINPARIYIVTTNQLLKFKDAFDLIIIDEVDAFPFEHNEKYDYAVERSCKLNGTCVYLTSTPSEKILNKNMDTFIINRRWHGHDLPVPKFKFLFLGFMKLNLIPPYFKKMVMSNRKQLWFVSNINLGKKILRLMLKKFPSLKIEFVYSTDPNRREKIIGFEKDKYQILITTTILERGVTFADIDVYVLDSNNPLYNVASLVQIAGRVGRKKEFQNGKI